MEHAHVIDDVAEVLATEDEIAARVGELAAKIEADYAGRDLLLVGVLNGAATVTVDLARALHRHVEITWMGISSYGAGQGGSGAVRLRKDIDVEVAGREVLIVDGVIDTGLTAAWLMTNLRARGPASLEFCGLFRKPSAQTIPIDIRYVGFDVPTGVVVGYGLDYQGRYRNLRCCARLAPHVYEPRSAHLVGDPAHAVGDALAE
ncbi:hypoxanthine phosphoribosyltransferase [Asanoa iriomotensis]|uniref:Hypoxanthine phosphoribosyltransferase n=1 Tax=Asanoa iriomotensis TaxID=234613 RepID=A0ABQ4CAU1_9ACTN|nr:hypoxanthine phosphoribosyltransferase [Asanoa iriomotensis]GIF59902.1 hypoxanthine phosphoribosyltransferase [Asanoa iriomotensis]